MKKADITLSNNCCLVSGYIHFENVMSVYELGLQYLKQFQNLEFDLSGVIESDSSGVALMLEWLNTANKTRKIITFLKIPPRLVSIIKSARMEYLFNLS